MSRCEDYPCCGHTPEDPCGVQPYDLPAFREQMMIHVMCDHAAGVCDVEPDEVDPEDCGHEDRDFMSNGEIHCYNCDEVVGRWEGRDADGWPIEVKQ